MSDEAYAMGNPFGGGYRPAAAPAPAPGPAPAAAAAREARAAEMQGQTPPAAGGFEGTTGGFTTAMGGECVRSEEYEVLCCALGSAVVAPMPASGGRIPANALAAGWEADGSPLYVLDAACFVYTCRRLIGLSLIAGT